MGVAFFMEYGFIGTFFSGLLQVQKNLKDLDCFISFLLDVNFFFPSLVD